MIKYCEICGKQFEVFEQRQMKRKYCSPECVKEKYRRAWHEKKDETQTKMTTKDNRNIDKINAEARKNGMSYGQYQAMKYMKEGAANG